MSLCVEASEKKRPFSRANLFETKRTSSNLGLIFRGSVSIGIFEGLVEI